MINVNESGGSKQKPDFSAHAILRRLERELNKKEGKPSFKAQELYYDAMEAATEEEEFALIQKALQIDPGNVDALLTVLRHCPLTGAQEIEALRNIVKLAEQRLGPAGFKEYAGVFWGVLETRPYMRAREQLAETLRYAGHIEQAIVEWEGMLELNPNDNQGVRYSLIACYLAVQRLDDAAKLFKKYGECPYNTVFAWGQVLERFLRGNLAGAVKALAVARKQNPYTEAYIKGQRRLPKDAPPAYSPGSEEEAACFAETLLMAWTRYPDALRWLDTQTPAQKRRRKNI